MGEKLCCLVLLMLVWLVSVLFLFEIISELCGYCFSNGCRMWFRCGLVWKLE